MAKKFNTNELMKNFIPDVIVENNNNEDQNKINTHLENKQADKLKLDTSVKEKAAAVKEATKPVTFLMPESVYNRIVLYTCQARIKGKKITQSQIINKAILKYLEEELGI